MNAVNNLHKFGFQQLIPLEEAIGKFFPRCLSMGTEEVPVQGAARRILSVDISSPLSLPPFARSAMDGYALRAQDTFGATASKSRLLKVVGAIPIGSAPDKALGPGEVMEIATGAPLPVGADAVIRVEDTKLEDTSVRIFQALAPLENVFSAGEDVPKGMIVMKKGAQVRPDQLGLLRSMGLEKIPVYRRPRVAAYSTGDELSQPGSSLLPGKIYESNSVMLAELVKCYNAEVFTQKWLPDDPDTIRREVQNAFETADMVVCSGGTSVGTKDFLPMIVAELGEIVVHGVGLKPGSPILLGIIAQKPIICLPGYPVACYIGIVAIAGPLIRQMQSANILDPRPIVYGRLAKNVSVKGLGRINYLRVTVQESTEGFVVIPRKLSGSGHLRSLAESDGIVEIPADVEGLDEKEMVKVYLHPR